MASSLVLTFFCDGDTTPGRMARHGRKATRAWLEALEGVERVEECVYRVRIAGYSADDVQAATNALLLSRPVEASRLARHMRTSAVSAVHYEGTPDTHFRVWFRNLLAPEEWRARQQHQRAERRLVLGLWSHEGRLSYDLAAMIALYLH